MFRPEVDAPASSSTPDVNSARGYFPAATAFRPPSPAPGGDTPLRARQAAPDARRPRATAREAGRIEPEDEPRRLAARLLDRTLLRLGRAGVVVERRLAPGLARLRERRLYRQLGYVRLADYLTERLGMSLRRCQSILRLERALASLPRMAQALEGGEVSVSKLEIAASAATMETEAAWLERAKRLPLAGLREIARRASPLPAVSSSPAESAAGATTPDLPMAPDPPKAPDIPRTPDLPIEQDEPGRLISFAAPASILAVWHWTLDLVRRAAGQQEPAWRCAEYLAAEFLSGVPDTAGDPASCRPDDPPVPSKAAPASAPDDPPVPSKAAPAAALGPAPDSSVSAPVSSVPSPVLAGRAPHSPISAPDFAAHDPNSPDRAPDLPARDAPGMAAWLEAVAAVREALASIGASAEAEVILSERPAVGDSPQQGTANPDPDLDAWELDARLRHLVRVRQSLAWRQGHLLATFASLRLHRDLGFDTFDDWIGERLTMSTRRARYLVSLSRRLRDLPLLADAYRRGLVSWCQARLLVRVVRPATQSRWIRYARRVTVRRLEEVIVAGELSSANSSSPPLPSPLPSSPGSPASASPSLPAHIGASRTGIGTPPAHIGASPRPEADPLPPADPLPLPEPLPASDPLPPSEPLPDTAAPHSSSDSLLFETVPPPLDHLGRHTSAPPAVPHSIPVTADDRRPTRRITFWCPLDVAALWDSALRACRAAAEYHLEDWECFLVLAGSMRDTWENQEDPHWRRRYRIFERDGWRCKAPGCTSRSGLNEHHIVFRSRRGGDDAENLVTLCVGHHQQGLHEGHIRCFGNAPDGLWWDLGVKPGGEPLVCYFGDRVVRRRPFIPLAPPRPPAMASPHRPAAVTAGAG